MPFTDAVWNSIQCRIISQITGKDVEGNEVFTLKRRPAIRMERLNKIMHILRTTSVASATVTAHILNTGQKRCVFNHLPEQQVCSGIQRTLSLSLSITERQRESVQLKAPCILHTGKWQCSFILQPPMKRQPITSLTKSMEQRPSWEA